MSTQRIAKAKLQAFAYAHNFSELFIQLGWDTKDVPSGALSIQLGEQTFAVQRVAEKRGFVVCVCDAGGAYPSKKSLRTKFSNQLAKHHYEHLLIIHGDGKQHWSVAIRPQNRPMRIVEVEWYENHDIQLLMEKLDGLVFDLSEEEKLGISDVVERVRHAFMENAETVTKNFYREFKIQLNEFAEFIQGINDAVSKEHYAALMLNRLMFIYFIQKKKFLDGNPDYLTHQLRTSQQQGENQFYDRFYRHFLRRLFSEGLGTSENQRSSELKRLIGRVPYLNGGLFDLHQIEQSYQHIQIQDAAFEKLFAFFDKYNWHLDTKVTASGRDINPDVIGYIFEKYINDRAEMGAYYTQEDITNYIARSTIIPFLLQRTREKCKKAFDPSDGIWRFLRESPERYIHAAVQKGCELEDQKIPANIRRGIDPNAPDLLSRRAHWNTPADQKFALPSEIWRETIARRTRFQTLKSQIARGEISQIEDLITHNLDIERFATDALRHYEGSDFLAAFYEAIAGTKPLQSNQVGKRGITILDPACGSGAFLFAALNILEPLYSICVQRMREFVEEDDLLREQGNRKGSKKFPQFRAVLADIAKHANEKYWIYKTIILNNLYGVDLMREASEIAKLRLFLKLAAEAEYQPDAPNLGLEPLPDIDYNIRSGNSLVGFASMTQFERAIAIDPNTGQRKVALDQSLIEKIREQAWQVRRANQRFRESQDRNDSSYRGAKAELGKQLAALNEQLNKYLAAQYSVQKSENAQGYQNWETSHQPFHWLADFYGIVEEDGGFDVVIGNPPYVEYSKVRKVYTVRDYETKKCGNIYAYFMELATRLQKKQVGMGMIVPISAVSTPRTASLRQMLEKVCLSTHISNYADRPGTLFSGVHQKVSIILASGYSKTGLHTTNFLHWSGRTERPFLFESVYYCKSVAKDDGVYPKFGYAFENIALKKIDQHKHNVLSFLDEKQSLSIEPVYLNMRLMFWVKAMLLSQKSSEFKTFRPKNPIPTKEWMVLLNSNVFFWLWESFSDCWHLTKRELGYFCINPQKMGAKARRQLAHLADTLQADLEANKKFVGTKQTDYEYYHKKSKHIIDQIDIILAKHYGFSDEELDYVINYDIKYRMGLGK